MTDALWQTLTDTIDPMRGEIGADPDGSTWQTLCGNLSGLLARHGWPALSDVREQTWYL